MNKLMKAAPVLLALLVSTGAQAQEPVKGYAPVNGLKMYYEVHGKGAPVVLLHGSFMTITNKIFGDMRPRSASRLAVLPDTTHVSSMQKIDVIAPLIHEFLDAKAATK